MNFLNPTPAQVQVGQLKRQSGRPGHDADRAPQERELAGGPVMKRDPVDPELAPRFDGRTSARA